MSYWGFDVKSLKFSAFNDPINDFYSEKTITPEDYLNATHPDDVVFVRKYMEHMFRGIDKDFNVKYRSKTKWDDEWQTLLVTGIQLERDKEGHVTRYTGITINNTSKHTTQRFNSQRQRGNIQQYNIIYFAGKYTALDGCP